MTDYSRSSEVQVETPEDVKITIFPAMGHKPVIEWEYPEFQSLCPVSERHDQGVVVITYIPDKNILESKSVRDYLMMWRNKRNWQEYITGEIAEKLFRACKPEWLKVEIRWSARGGIFARTTAERGSRAS